MSTTKDNRFIQPYLFFNGSCEQAIEFYRKALGAEIEMMMRFKESPEPPPPGAVPPGCSADKLGFQGFSLSLSVPTEAEADRAFNTLADGGQVKMPLMKTFFSPRFGMLEDRFGIGWIIQAAPEGQK